MLRNGDNDRKNKRGHYQHIAAWDSLGRVTATVNRLDSCVYVMVATSGFLNFFQEFNPRCGFDDINPEFEQVHPS